MKRRESKEICNVVWFGRKNGERMVISLLLFLLREIREKNHNLANEHLCQFSCNFSTAGQKIQKNQLCNLKIDHTLIIITIKLRKNDITVNVIKF